jgi:hypothetical protein
MFGPQQNAGNNLGGKEAEASTARRPPCRLRRVFSVLKGMGGTVLNGALH